MIKPKNIFYILFVLALQLQWVVLKFSGYELHEPWNALSPGIAIFGAAFMLSWGAELAQFEIPQSLALAFLALIAVLPEYAVDMYFAWKAGSDPQYIHYATANMTGANRLLIGVGWAVVVFASFFKTKKGEVQLEKGNRVELFCLVLATVYCLVIPIKHSISWVDTIFLLSIFFWYVFQAGRSHHEAPEAEGPILEIASWKRFPRILATLVFFGIAGLTIFISAEPFAEGLLHTGRKWGVQEFILVQWLAPLASESPEFIVAILFALRAQGAKSLSTLVASKVNQWTLLIGLLPIVYNFSAGHWGPMPLDSRQSEEILLTAAQSFFAITIIANLRFSITEALILFVLFITQMFFTSVNARIAYSFMYLLLGVGWFFIIKDNKAGFIQIFKDGIKHPKKIGD